MKQNTGSKTRYIFRATIRLKDGTVLRAKDYGKRAFCIPVGETKPEKP